jgi:hypothetical protein
MITLKFVKGNDGLVRFYFKYPNYVGGMCYAKDFQNNQSAQELIDSKEVTYGN